MSKVGIRIETFVGGGRYQHKVVTNGDYQKSCNIPEEIIDAQKRLNEKLWEHMPEGAHSLTSNISYRESRPTLASKLTGLLRRCYQSPSC